MHRGDRSRRMFFPAVARRNFARVGALCSSLPPVQPALSVKTNPRPQLLQLALDHGFFAEVISPQELHAVRALGFDPQRIIYNGPRALEQGTVYCAFADSLEAFGRYCMHAEIGIAGVRVRPSGIDSRFGIQRDALAR
ncbi:MAG: hypothetical protein M3Z37_11565, partial [Candidatus Eremiobacteraeota bacterium]|nr:hypothetical protein [Candidatus Eremiobacteraeota bacterium]